MNYRIEGHRLSGDSVEQVDCSGKDSGLFTAGLPDTVVIHFTGGSSLQSSVDHLTAPDIKASAHLVIGRDGRVRQLISFDRIAWHAGISKWKGRQGINKYSIGIELDNAGRMTKSGTSFISWFGRQYPPEQMIEAKHRNEGTTSFWHVYTEVQVAACFSICRCLANAYPISMIVGHEEISPGRKIDPGPAFPLERLRDHVLLGRVDDPTSIEFRSTSSGILENAVVVADLLNIRKLPYVGAVTVGNPLPVGTKVQILERSEKWCRVIVSKQGWVHGDYLQIEK